MNLLRKLALMICGFFLFTASLGLAWSVVAAQTVRDRDTVKGWLEDSSFYDQATDAVLDGLEAEQGNTADLPLKDPALQAKLRDIFDANFVRQNVGGVLDGVYDWLDGKTDRPEFAIDLTDVRPKLAAAAGQYAAERASTLPICTSVPANYDALTADCVPPGVNATQIAQTVETDLLNNPEFLKDEVLTVDSFSKDGSVTPEESKPVQDFYRASSNVPLISGLVVAVTVLGITFLSQSRLSGLRRVGGVWISVAVVLGIAYGLLYAVPKAIERADQSREAVKFIGSVVDVVASDIRGIVGIWAIGYAVVGIGLVVATTVLKQKGQSPKNPTPPTGPKPPIDDSAPQVETPTPEEKPQPKPPRKIQL